MKAGSSSLVMLAAALAGAREAGAETELLDLRLLDLPMYTPAAEPTESARTLARAFGEAQGLIWSTPVYHGGMSGAFKNALDWLELLSQNQPAYLTDKVIGLLSAAGGVQGLQAINTMEFAARALRGWTLPLTLPLDRAWQLLDERGEIRDAQLDARLRQVGAEVAAAAARLAR